MKKNKLNIILVLLIACNNNQANQVFGEPSETIDISVVENYDPTKEFQLAIKCTENTIKYFEGKDAGYAYYNSEGLLIEYCGRYAKNINIQKCEELENNCPS